MSNTKNKPRLENFRKSWYKFSRNPMSILGLVLVIAVILITVFAKSLAPYPDADGLTTDMMNAFKAPSSEHLAGTDEYGRDVFSRILIGLRPSMSIGLMVLTIAVPFGVLLGLIAGFFKGMFIDTFIMRFTELFMAVPPLILAMVVCTMFINNYTYAALGIAIAWWPWYTRLTYNLVVSLTNELFIVYTELTGVNVWRVLISEILPNTTSSIITKMSLDMGSIIIVASSMSFVGLGVQPPTPSLGSMVSEGIPYLPEFWWLTVMPALMVVIIVMGFNLLGDGLNDVFNVEDK